MHVLISYCPHSWALEGPHSFMSVLKQWEVDPKVEEKLVLNLNT